MRKLFAGKTALWLGGSVLFLAGCLVGRQMPATQKTLLHVFAFTPPEGAMQKDFDDFQKATGDMVGKIPGLRRAWVGKLREPVPAEADSIRTFAAAMEFDDVQALNVYASHPAHTEWNKVYQRVRTRSSTTLDILGE